MGERKNLCTPTGCLIRLDSQCIDYTGPAFKNLVGSRLQDILVDIDNKISSGGPSVTKVTYSQFINLINQNKLIPESYYIMTDFQTLHDILEVRYVGSTWQLVNTGQVNEAPIEPLIFKAKSTSEYYENMVYSTILGHRIIYTQGGGGLPYSGTLPFKGTILRRIDEVKNVSIPFDWQMLIWSFDGTTYRTFSGYLPGDNLLNPLDYGDNIYVSNQKYYSEIRPFFMTQTSGELTQNFYLGGGEGFVACRAVNSKIDTMSNSAILPDVKIAQVNVNSLNGLTQRTVFPDSLSDVRGDFLSITSTADVLKFSNSLVLNGFPFETVDGSSIIPKT